MKYKVRTTHETKMGALHKLVRYHWTTPFKTLKEAKKEQEGLQKLYSVVESVILKVNKDGTEDVVKS